MAQLTPQEIEQNIENLLKEMTLEEKIGQMMQIDARHNPHDQVKEYKAGSALHVIGPETVEIQKTAAQTGKGIPIIFGDDAIHGHAFWPKATVFPTQLAMSCSWNTDLIEEAGRITARDVRATGIHWTFSPVLGVARDLRWGRINETFGEDTWLVAELGAALIRGYQGSGTEDPERVLACAKHFAGYCETQGGRDSSEADLSKRKLLSIFLPTFERAAREGCATFMTGYQAIDGIPSTANRWLLTEVLKEQWGLDGFVVTDWDNFGRMHREQKVYATTEEAAAAGIIAGNDMCMITKIFCESAKNAVNRGLIEESIIDNACRRILRMKYKLGLFNDDQRYPDIEKLQERIGLPEDRDHAFECGVQSAVLLKNSGILPLEGIKSIAVTGPNADNTRDMLGDWAKDSGQVTYPENDPYADEVVTVLDGLKKRAGNNITVNYAKGCEVRGDDLSGIPEAVSAAEQSDVIVAVIGDTLSLVGEACDRADLNIGRPQKKLLKKLKKTGKPLIVVLVNSKPLSIPWIAEQADAILECFNPGMKGGDAAAAILFGDRNPCGKLTISFPHHVGQLPVYYNQIPGWHNSRYADMPAGPLFPFGFGLSYTGFEYSDMQLDKTELSEGEELTVSVTVKNTGKRAGTEIVQAYVNDVYSSVTTPVKELKGFARIELKPGQSETVSITIPFKSLSLVNADLQRVVEPGEFEIMVGPSSKDEDLLKTTFTVGTEQ